MTSRSGKWRSLKGILAGILLILPLFQIAAPGLLALAADDGVWCQSLATIDTRSDSQNRAPDADDCMVCLAVAIGGSSASPNPPAVPAPRRSVLSPTPESLTGLVDSLAEAHPPIRAPPIA